MSRKFELKPIIYLNHHVFMSLYGSKKKKQQNKNNFTLTHRQIPLHKSLIHLILLK